MFMAALAFSFGAAELFLRAFPSHAVYLQVRNVVQQSHSAPSKDTVMKYEPAPLLEKRFRNREFDTRVATSSRGLRDREYQPEKKEGVKRVMALGDSFVFGWGVENAEVFTEVLEDRWLKNAEVWNLGVSGYSVDQMTARLKKDGLPYAPDVVMMEILGEPTSSDGNFIFRNGRLYFSETAEFVFFQKAAAYLERRSYVCAALGLALRKQLSARPSESAYAEAPPDGYELVDEFLALARQNSFIPVLFYVPVKHDFMRPGPALLEQKARFLNYCREKQAACLDLEEPLRRALKSGKPPYFKLDDHWNRAGHEAAALAVRDFLKSAGILPPEYLREA